MNNLKIKKYDNSLLNHAKLITNGNSYFKTYDLNNGNIIKVVKSVDECLNCENAMFLYSSYDYFIDELYNKLLFSNNIEIQSILTPNCVYLDNNDIPRAYTVQKLVNYISLDEYCIKNSDLNSISPIFLELTNEIRKANSISINFPDLGNASNILINKNNKDIKLIDYDGLQIDKYESFCISSLVLNNVIPLFEDKRMNDIKKGLVTNNLDKLSLYSLFIYYTTKKYLNNFGPQDYTFMDGQFKLKKDVLLNFTKSIGINDTYLENDLLELFYNSRINYPDTSIKKLAKTHILKDNLFIKK